MNIKTKGKLFTPQSVISEVEQSGIDTRIGFYRPLSSDQLEEQWKQTLIPKQTEQNSVSQNIAHESSALMKKKSLLSQQLAQLLEQNKMLIQFDELNLAIKPQARIAGKSSKLVGGAQFVRQLAQKAENKTVQYSPLKQNERSKSKRKQSTRKKAPPNTRASLLFDLKQKKAPRTSSKVIKNQVCKNYQASQLEIMNPRRLRESVSKEQKSQNNEQSSKQKQKSTKKLALDRQNQEHVGKVSVKQQTYLQDIIQQESQSLYIPGKQNKVFQKSTKHQQKMKQKVQRKQISELQNDNIEQTKSQSQESKYMTQLQQSFITDGSKQIQTESDKKPKSRLIKKSQLKKPRKQEKKFKAESQNKNNQKRKIRKKKPFSEFLQYEAEKSDSSSDQQESEDEDDEDIKDLINNDHQQNKEEDQKGYALAAQHFRKQDQLNLQKVIENNFNFKKKQIPPMIQYQKLKENRRKKQNCKLSQKIQQILKIQKNEDNILPYLPLAPKNEGIEQIAYQNYDVKEVYEFQHFANKKIKPERLNFQVPKMLKQRQNKSMKSNSNRRSQKSSLTSHSQQSSQQIVVDKNKSVSKRGSLIEKSAKVKNCQGSTQVGYWMNNMKGFIIKQEPESEASNSQKSIT